MTTLKFILVILVVSVSFSCHTTNTQDATLLNQLWTPKDSLAFYFPQNSNPDTGFARTRADSFKQKWYSSALFSFREPILYNKKLSISTYRFLWLRSFHRPVVFTLSKFGNKVFLTSKILDEQPEFLEHKYRYPKDWPGLEDELKGKTVERFGDSLLIVKADRKANIVYDSTIQLTTKEWDTFEQLLQKTNFWKQPALSNEERGFDGSEWIIEALNKDKYWFITRWAPVGDVKAVGVYLITLSGLKEKVY